MSSNNLDYLNTFKFKSRSEYEKSDKPILTEPSVKFFLKSVLNNCNNIKVKNNNFIYNICMFLLFIFIFSVILINKYKGNKTKEEIYQKNLKDKQYIMSKLVYYNKQNLENNQRIKNNLITNLPDYSDHPEANMLHKKIYFN